jgi:SAM-dependent methyltransferase
MGKTFATKKKIPNPFRSGQKTPPEIQRALFTPVSNSREPDFGTYHHSMPKGSEKLRVIIGPEFVKAFAALPFSADEEISILDVGCGLGFISCVCAKFYRRAHVTGVDIFKHASLKGSNLAKASENAKILGLSDRVHFKKGDVFSTDYSESGFDLFVSNLVFHNFRKRRFEAYDRLASWMSPNSYALLGDLFFDRKAEVNYISRVFKIEKMIEPKIGSAAYWILVLSKT